MSLREEAEAAFKLAFPVPPHSLDAHRFFCQGYVMGVRDQIEGDLHALRQAHIESALTNEGRDPHPPCWACGVRPKEWFEERNEAGPGDRIRYSSPEPQTEPQRTATSGSVCPHVFCSACAKLALLAPPKPAEPSNAELIGAMERHMAALGVTDELVEQAVAGHIEFSLGILREFVAAYGPRDGVDTRGAFRAIRELTRRLQAKEG